MRAGRFVRLLAEPKAKGETQMAEKQDRGKKNQIDIARAWKDPEYRKSLTPEMRALLPEDPTGPPPASAEELREVLVGELTSRFDRGNKYPDTKYPDCCYNSTIGPKATG